MKPDWKDAPTWANWLAQDFSGIWYWYENEPIDGALSWNNYGGMMERADAYNISWRDTKEPRP